MNTCLLCKNPLSSRQKKFCSKLCLVKSNGSKVGGWNKNKSQLTCKRCGKKYEVSNYRVKDSKYCSRLCHNRTNSENLDKKGNNNPNWKGGIQTYREKAWKFFDRKCCVCGTDKKLEIHHINEDRYDNRIENLQPVCRRCHQQIDGRSKRDDKNRFVTRDASYQP